MDQHSRAQIRLILEDADAGNRKAVKQRLTAIYADQSAKGRLHSGGTVKVALDAIEETARSFITDCVDRVAPIAKDVEAFAMIHEAVEGSLRFLASHLEGIAVMAAGGHSESGFARVLEAADDHFSDTRRQLERQLEIHRFTFTVPQPPVDTTFVPEPTTAKSRGGKPLAAHWDEMWAAIAVMLYTGDLQPKTQADIERTMKDWLAARDLDVGDTSVRERARQLWQKLKGAE